MICLCLWAVCSADLFPRVCAASPAAASEHCIEFIKAAEGFSPQPYYDYNQYTVGYGTKCPSEKVFEYSANGIPRKEAEVLLRNELADIADTLNEKFIKKYNLTFTQNQLDALISFSYNIGTGWITYNSSLRNAILSNASESELVYAFGLYCTAGGKYLPGLVTRRLCEADMYLNGIYTQKVRDAFGYVYYDANGGSVTYRVQAYLCENPPAPAADAVRNGDTFLGWYTDLTGGTQVSTLSHALSGQTLFARWQSSLGAEDQDAAAVTVTVTGDVVNIRSGPGTNYGIVRQSRRNEVLTVSHVTHLTNMKWGRTPDGWICLDYTNYDAVTGGATEDDNVSTEEILPPVRDEELENEMPDAAPENPEVIHGTVNVNNYLIIREGPGTNYPAVGFLFKNDPVEILAQKTAGARNWGQIAAGWVCMDYILTGQTSAGDPSGAGGEQETPSVQETPDTTGKAEAAAITGTITADALRIRSAAGTANPIVGFYYQNDTVFVYEKVLVNSDYWGKTDRGWISMNYVLAGATDGGSSQPAGGQEKTIIADCLRIRKEPGTKFKIVGFLYYGDTATVLETKEVDGTLWGRVDTGWICMQYAV